MTSISESGRDDFSRSFRPHAAPAPSRARVLNTSPLPRPRRGWRAARGVGGLRTRRVSARSSRPRDWSRDRGARSQGDYSIVLRAKVSSAQVRGHSHRAAVRRANLTRSSSSRRSTDFNLRRSKLPHRRPRERVAASSFSIPTFARCRSRLAEVQSSPRASPRTAVSVGPGGPEELAQYFGAGQTWRSWLVRVASNLIPPRVRE